MSTGATHVEDASSDRIVHSGHKNGGRNERRIALIILLFLSATYIAISGYLASFHAFWSADCGARFAMVRNWIAHGSLTHLYYAASASDPTGRINGLSYFLYHKPHSFTSIYAPLYPLATGSLYRIFGWCGLSIVPVLSGLGTVWLIYLTACRLGLRCRTWLLVATGLGTPLLIYSAVYWDHVTLMLLTAICGYCLLRTLQEQNARFAACAGASLGTGVFIHELMLFLSIAIILAAIPLLWKRDELRIMLGLLGGLLPFVLIWLGSNILLYGNFAGAHVAGNVGSNTIGHLIGPQDLFNIGEFIIRVQRELAGWVAFQVNEEQRFDLIPYMLVFSCLLIIYWALGRQHELPLQMTLVVSLVLIVLCAFLVFQMHWAHSMFLATPLFIPALAVPWDAARTMHTRTSDEIVLVITRESLFYAWISRSCWIFVLLVVLSPMLPIVGWGNRFLLTMLPFLALLAAHALEEQFLASGPRWRRVAAASIAGLVGLSIACQVEGLTMVRRNILYNRDINQRVSAIKSSILIFDDVGMAAQLTAAGAPQIQLLARNETIDLFIPVLSSLHAKSFAFVGPPGHWRIVDNLHLSPKQYFAHVGRTQILRKNPSEDGLDLQIDRFVLKTRPPANKTAGR